MQNLKLEFYIDSVLVFHRIKINEAYPGEMNLSLTLGVCSVNFKFTMWLLPGVGFVKMKESLSPDFGQPQTGWRIKELRSKNF